MGKSASRKGRPLSPASPGLGERLRWERLRAGLTLAQLGAPVYQAGYVSNLEHGRVKPSLDALGHLAERLGVSVAELLGAQERPLSAADAVGRAQRTLLDALNTASADDRAILAAVSTMLGALRRSLRDSSGR